MEPTQTELLEQYIRNLRTVRSLSKPIFSDRTSPAEVLARIQNNALQSHALMQENNALLQTCVCGRDPASLTDEEITGLEAFAGRLFNYSNSEDVALSHRVHQLLLEAARSRGNDPMIIKELYLNGVTLHYMNVRDENLGINLLGDQIQAFFHEGADYIRQYEKLDKTTRQYILRCIGNMRLGISRGSYEKSREYLKLFDQAMGIFSSSYYRGLDPEFPWDSYIYSMHMDRITLMERLCITGDPELAQEVLKSAEYVWEHWEHQKKDEKEEARLQNWRVSYFYYAARFHAGVGPVTELLDALLEAETLADDRDFSVDGVYHNLTAAAYLLSYAKFLTPEEKICYRPVLEQVREKAHRYLEAMPASQYPRVVGNAAWELTIVNSGADETENRRMLSSILAGHKPTYVHSLMVAWLTRTLVQRLIECSPERLVGLLGCRDAAEVQARRKELCRTAYECGLYHDIGKSAVIMYIDNNARRLLDEEFCCIQSHPSIGSRMLERVCCGRNLAPAALYHHCFYNGKGGYPAGAKACPAEIKGIVDALSVADSLDAATDNIGRSYNAAKPFRALLEELRAQSGTRYAPYVVELFENEGFCVYLDHTLTSERKKVYLQVYHADPKKTEA